MIATLSITNIVYFGIGQILAVTFRKSEACCVLNAVKVRATNLQELVYKNGQAGVTKATVSIMFDNSNKQQSPMGYEIYDEITVTRQVTIRDVPDIRFRFLLAGYPAVFFYPVPAPVPAEMVPGTGYLYRIVKLFEMDGTL